jgi:hypothetical protein
MIRCVLVKHHRFTHVASPYLVGFEAGRGFREPQLEFWRRSASRKVDMFSRMSSRQGCGSSEVRVLTPSITCIRRLAYSVRAEATKHVQPERKSLGCPVR